MGLHSLTDYRSLTSILKPITQNQYDYLSSIKSNPITIVDGPAGTGKTFLAMLEGLRACLSDHKQDKWCQSLILLRPGVGVGQDLGYLPGSYGEKIHLFMRPFKDIGAKILGEKEYARVEKFISYETPYHRRGTTFDNAFVVVDEAQNITPTEMIMILTRLGKRGKIVIAGDGRQSDIRHNNGLREAQIRLSGLKSIKVIKTTLLDMQRSGIVAKIIKAWYNGYYEENSEDSQDEPCDKQEKEDVLDDSVDNVDRNPELHYDDDLSIFSWDKCYDKDGD